MGVSTLDIQALIKTNQNDETKHVVILGLSNAFDSLRRDLLCTTTYAKIIPWNFIRMIRVGQANTKIRPKIKAVLGKKPLNNKEVPQGSPLSAPLFIIYFDNVLKMYTEEQQKWEYSKKIQEITAKNGKAEKAWAMYKYWNNHRERGEYAKETGIQMGERKVTDDKHIYMRVTSY